MADGRRYRDLKTTAVRGYCPLREIQVSTGNAKC